MTNRQRGFLRKSPLIYLTYELAHSSNIKKMQAGFKNGIYGCPLEESKRIYLDEISMVIIENIAVSITGCLLAELNARKIKVILCDEKRNPASELVSLYGSHDCSLKIKNKLGGLLILKLAFGLK